MKRRFWIPLLLILILPILMIGWLGMRLAQDEQEILQSRYRDLLRERLLLIHKQVEDFLVQEKTAFLQFIPTRATDKNMARQLLRRTGLVTQMFKANHRGSLLFPHPNWTDISEKEREFILRTKEIWDSKALQVVDTSDEPVQSAVQKPMQQSGSSFGNQTSTSNRAPQSYKTQAPDLFWHTFYFGNGLHLLMYRRTTDGAVYGIEVDRSRFIADLVAALPDEARMQVKDGSIVMYDSSADPLMQWGKTPPQESLNSVVEVALPAPLSAWKLAYHSAPGAVGIGRSSTFNIASGIILLIVCVTGLAFYLYRERSREFREARQRVNFVNQVSHELKTPLTNIRMYAELLENQIGDQDTSASQQLSVIVQESQRLSRLIHNILTFAKGERKALTLKRTPGRVSELVSEVRAYFLPSFQDKGISIKTQCSDKAEVLFDRDLAQQILGNLLSNVEKYASESKLVRIEASREEETTIVVVSDQGPGISEGLRGRIFEAFQRGSDDITEGVSGTGIGLSIARKLARLHGGDLTLEESETGAVFRLTLQTPASGVKAI